MSATKKSGQRARHKLARQKAQPNAQSLEAVMDLLTLLQGYAELLPARERPKLLAYLDAVTVWAQERRCRRVTDNLALVWKDVGSHYRVALETAGIAPEDAVQEGCIGLMRAAELFDEARGFEFSTYATRWIRQGISRMLARGYLIHVPEHLTRSPKGKKTYLKHAEKVKKIISLDMPLPGEDEVRLGNTVPDPSSLREVDETVAAMDLPDFLRWLCPLDQEILRLYHMEGLTLEEVADELARKGLHRRVTRERIRQMIWRAMKRVRKWSSGKGWADVV